MFMTRYLLNYPRRDIVFKRLRVTLSLSIILATFLALGACTNNDEEKNGKGQKMEDMNNMDHENMDMDEDKK